MSASNASPEQLLLRTQKVMNALDDWGLTGEQILAVLDFPSTERSRHLARYRKDTPFPDDEKVICRVTFLLGIIDALRTTYPRNLQMGARWMAEPHIRLKNRCPLQAMLEDGEQGVVAVLSERRDFLIVAVYELCHSGMFLAGIHLPDWC